MNSEVSRTPAATGALPSLAQHIDDARSIQDIQGAGLESPFAGQAMTRPVRGVVTGHLSVPLRRKDGETLYVRAVTVQMPDAEAVPGDASRAIVVVPPKGSKDRPKLGSEVSFLGRISEVSQLSDSPFEATTTVVFSDSLKTLQPGAASREEAFELIKSKGVSPYSWDVEKVEAKIEERLAAKGQPLTPENFRAEQRLLLSSLESALFYFEPGSKLASPSNPFGDYVFTSPEHQGATTIHGAPFLTPEWFDRALFNVGLSVGYKARSAALRSGGAGKEAYPSSSALLEGVWGALSYRAGGPQVDAARGDLPIAAAKKSELPPVRLEADPKKDLVTLSLNTFNFDPHVEDPDRVSDPSRDISDDIGEGRHLALVDAICRTDSLPGVIAFQEMQKNDGAELTNTLEADQTYEAILGPLRERTGKDYQYKYFMEPWTKSGGQPGGNIHLGFAWDPEVLTPMSEPIPLGLDTPAMHESRKPLAMAFRHNETGEPLVLVNVHNTSLRYTNSPIAKANPGEDPRAPLRVEQNRTIVEFLAGLDKAGIAYQVTGDFNDTEFSASLRAFEEEGKAIVAPKNGHEQADYNHRGIAQNLSHLITRKSDVDRVVTMTSFNEQSHGVPMGQLGGGRSSDHGVFWAKMGMKAPTKEVEDLSTVLKRAANRANGYAAKVARRAKEDTRLLAALSHTLLTEEWVELAGHSDLAKRPGDLVAVAGLVEPETFKEFLATLDRDEARALRDAAFEAGLMPLVRLLRSARKPKAEPKSGSRRK